MSESIGNAVASGGGNVNDAASAVENSAGSGGSNVTPDNSSGVFGINVNWDTIASKAAQTGFNYTLGAITGMPVGAAMTVFGAIAKGVDMLPGANPNQSFPGIGNLLVEAAKGVARGDIHGATPDQIAANDANNANRGAALDSSSVSFNSGVDITGSNFFTPAVPLGATSGSQGSQGSAPSQQTQDSAAQPTPPSDGKNPFAPEIPLLSTIGSVWF